MLPFYAYETERRRRKSDPRHEESKAADQADTALCKPRVDLGLIRIV